jgi:PKD repeat protein
MKAILCFLSLWMALAVSAQTVDKAEYFFDNDPGFGNGTSVVITPGVMVNFNFNANISGLDAGIHTLSVRVKSSGIWGQTHSRMIGVSADVGITSVEYFFDSDPGFGNGMPVPVAPGKVVDLNFDANISGLDPGIHTLSLRVFSETWSQTYSRFVGISPDVGITNAEYFFDTDPGFGNGIPAPVAPGNVVDLNFNANISGLEPGIHTLLVRVFSGTWSQTYSRLIGVSPDAGITSAEYFFDTDPGFGNGITVPVAPGKVVDINFDANISGLEPGIHTLLVRVFSGTWSQTYSRLIGVSPDVGITKAEYFLGEDPGSGNAIPIAITPGKMVVVDDVIENMNFPNGLNYIYFRVFAGQWSLTYIHEYCQNPIPDFNTDFAEFNNPTTFTNLTEQADQTTTYLWDVDGDGIFDYSGGEDFLHLYSEPGSYMAKLVVGSPGGCTDSILHEVLVYACMVPTALTMENITFNSVELDWTPGNFGNEWDILFGLQGFDPETEGTLIEGILTRPYELTGLEELTDYDFYVRTVCDAPDVSDWSGPQSFTTLQYFCTPDWEPTAFNQYNMQIIGKLFIDGEQTLDPHDFIGAFVDGECRGMASPDPDLFGLVFLSVGSDIVSGEMVDFVIWNVDECAECATGESILFENQLQVGTPGNPYPFACGQHELPLAFGAGYNWFSVNIDPGSMALNDLFAELNPCEEDRIIGQNAFSIVYNGNWVGSLTAIDAPGMYKMQLCSQQNLTIAGTPVANDPISLGAGYTWLGYLPQGGLSVNSALSAITPAPAEDNRLIGQNAFAVYYQGQWIGSLTQLHPGKGYVIELSSQSTLSYPAATDEILEPEEEIFSPTGDLPLALQQFSMMLIAQLELPDGAISTNPEDVIYAFAGDECRGMAIPAGEHGGIVFMSINSNIQAGEQITFKAWLSEFGALADIRETLSFEELKKAGTMDEPLLLTLRGFTGTGDQPSGDIFIGEPFPNPFSEITEIPFRLNNTAQVKISVYDGKGQLLVIVSDNEFNAGTHKAVIHRNGLQPGVYFYRMEVFGDQISTQKNGKIIIQ